MEMEDATIFCADMSGGVHRGKTIGTTFFDPWTWNDYGTERWLTPGLEDVNPEFGRCDSELCTPEGVCAPWEVDMGWKVR